MRLKIWFTALLLPILSTILGQPSPPANAIPTPKEFFGFTIGDNYISPTIPKPRPILKSSLPHPTGQNSP